MTGVYDPAIRTCQTIHAVRPVTYLLSPRRPGGEGVGVGGATVPDRAPPTSPSHAFGAGPSLSPLKGGEGTPCRAPTRNRATASIGFCVAESPMRSNRSPQSAANRSSEIAKCEPRLLGATAWISSTITVRVVASILRPDSEPNRI